MNLTIVTAIHNRIDGLNKVLDCLNKQTYQDFEHILVDDCSEELSYEQLDLLCKQDKRRHFVKLGFRSHFFGCFARDIGVLLSFCYTHHSKRDIDNEWVMFADTDNQWAPNHIESMIKMLESNPEATMIASDMEMFGENDKDWRQVRPCKITQGYVDLGSLIYKTSLFRKYGYFFAHPHRRQKYDFELINKMANGEGERLVFTHLPTFLMSYRKM